MSKADDIRWISQVVLIGNKQSFNHLVVKYQSSIRRFFANLTKGDTFLSDDLAQETFLKAYLKIHSFRGTSSFSTWLFRIAYNTYLDSVRAKKYFEDWNLQEIDENTSAEIDYSSKKNDIFAALQYVKKDEKVALLLFYMEDKSQKEIAKIMDLPLGTVKTNILKGKEKMEIFLRKNGYEK